MNVSELMTKKVITAKADEMVDRIFYLFHFENIRHIPIVSEKGKLVGIVSDRDIKKILGPKKKQHTAKDGTVLTVSARKIRTVMRRDPYTIGPDERAADAAALMVKRKVGALPVVNKGKLVGIITATDILKAFVKLCDIVEPFSKVAKK